jgi:Na+-driven multidrug efflux pump
MLIALPGLFIFLILTSVLSCIRDSVKSAVTLAIATAIGLVVTPALIQGWAGPPPQGVASGAYATIVSFPVASILLAFHLRRRRHPLAPSAKLLKSMRVDWQILGLVLRIGVRLACSSSLYHSRKSR